MRTGNALFSITFRRSGETEVRLTLLDDGVDGIAELVDAGAPWEESAAVPVEQMSRFRLDAESLPERWAPVKGDGTDHLAVSIESSGRTAGFEARLTGGDSLPQAHQELVKLVAQTVASALVGARSRRALDGLMRWISTTPADD